MNMNKENNKSTKTIAIIGAGASGCFCAMLASEYGYNVLLIEHTDMMAKKILMTGNGKCNLSNKMLDPTCYASSYEDKEHFLKEAFMACGYEKTVEIFKERGLYTKDKNELIYPASFLASAVTEFFIRRLKRNNVHILFKHKVKKITKNGSYCIETDKDTYYADYVIMACGGKSYEKTGSDGSGFVLAGDMGHTIKPLYPALVKYSCKENFFKMIGGIRTDALIRLYINDSVLSERGELQLTDDGISGIPVFQLSLFAGKDVSGIKGAVDFAPDVPESELVVLLNGIKNSYMGAYEGRMVPYAVDALSGFVHKKLLSCVMQREEIDPVTRINDITDKEIKRIARKIKNFDFTVRQSAGYDNAQVTAGGVSLDELTENLESRRCKGLFFVGEMVDVTGMCGGYNLQWAWTSAYLALMNGINKYENTDITNKN